MQDVNNNSRADWDNYRNHDQDGESGTISRDEFAAYAEEQGFDLTSDEIDTIFDTADESRPPGAKEGDGAANGTLSKREFDVATKALKEKEAEADAMNPEAKAADTDAEADATTADTDADATTADTDADATAADTDADATTADTDADATAVEAADSEPTPNKNTPISKEDMTAAAEKVLKLPAGVAQEVWDDMTSPGGKAYDENGETGVVSAENRQKIWSALKERAEARGTMPDDSAAAPEAEAAGTSPIEGDSDSMTRADFMARAKEEFGDNVTDQELDTLFNFHTSGKPGAEASAEGNKQHVLTGENRHSLWKEMKAVNNGEKTVEQSTDPSRGDYQMDDYDPAVEGSKPDMSKGVTKETAKEHYTKQGFSGELFDKVWGQHVGDSDEASPAQRAAVEGSMWSQGAPEGASATPESTPAATPTSWTGPGSSEENPIGTAPPVFHGDVHGTQIDGNGKITAPAGWNVMQSNDVVGDVKFTSNGDGQFTQEGGVGDGTTGALTAHANGNVSITPAAGAAPEGNTSLGGGVTMTASGNGEAFVSTPQNTEGFTVSSPALYTMDGTRASSADLMNGSAGDQYIVSQPDGAQPIVVTRVGEGTGERIFRQDMPDGTTGPAWIAQSGQDKAGEGNGHLTEFVQMEPGNVYHSNGQPTADGTLDGEDIDTQGDVMGYFMNDNGTVFSVTDSTSGNWRNGSAANIDAVGGENGAQNGDRADHGNGLRVVGGQVSNGGPSVSTNSFGP